MVHEVGIESLGKGSLPGTIIDRWGPLWGYGGPIGNYDHDFG